MNSINSAKKLRTIPTNWAISTLRFLILLLSKLKLLCDRIRASILGIMLSLVYSLILTPYALRNRKNLKITTKLWNDIEQTGWYPNLQSTADPKIFSDSSVREELLALAHTDKGDTVKGIPLLLYRVLHPLSVLATPPEKKELSADLYVMF
ncbi:MAG TPA: hypothetical protein VJZ32_11985 [Candidatus Bathyarchaeia archaeon]|nr:hypothetical protein [Candidatus Bathyarchaeia archaeon]